MDAIFIAKMWKVAESTVITIPFRELEKKKDGDLVKVTIEFIEEKKEE